MDKEKDKNMNARGALALVNYSCKYLYTMEMEDMKLEMGMRFERCLLLI